MKNYSINRISSDVYQFLVTFYKDTFCSIFEMLGDKFDVNCDLMTSFKEELKNKTLLTFIIAFIEFQLKASENFHFSKNIKPRLEILSESDDEVVVSLTEAIYVDSFKLKYPKMDEVEVKSNYQDYLTEDRKNEIINLILQNYEYVDSELTDEGTIVDSNIFVRVNGIEQDIREVLSYDEYKALLYVDGELNKLHIGQQIKAKNKLLKNGNIIYTISKIICYKTLPISDEIVQEINYKNCKTVDEFKERFFNDLYEVKKFQVVVEAIKERMLQINNFYISKAIIDLYNDTMDEDASDEEKKSVKDCIALEKLDYYIEKEMDEISNINTMLIENIVKIKFGIDKLVQKYNDFTYDEYLEEHLSDLKLYLYVKKQ